MHKIKLVEFTHSVQTLFNRKVEGGQAWYPQCCALGSQVTLLEADATSIQWK